MLTPEAFQVFVAEIERHGTLPEELCRVAIANADDVLAHIMRAEGESDEIAAAIRRKLDELAISANDAAVMRAGLEKIRETSRLHSLLLDAIRPRHRAAVIPPA